MQNDTAAVLLFLLRFLVTIRCFFANFRPASVVAHESPGDIFNR